MGLTDSHILYFCLLSGHSEPSASSGGETAGEKSSDTSTQEGSKSMLVMSGGEGYIDFRMGEFTTSSRSRVVISPSDCWGHRDPVCLQAMKMVRQRRLKTPP